MRNGDFFATTWRVIDNHWTCVSDSHIVEMLSDYLWSFGFDIPSCINYCLASNNNYSLKFRHHGGVIHCYIHKIKFIMEKIPKLEINCIPSRLNTSKPSGVSSQLANIAENKPHFDGITIEMMRNNPIYQRLDDIDKVGLAQKQIVDSANIVKSRAKFIRALNDHAQKLSKK